MITSLHQINTFLFLWYVVFGFTALVFEPAFYFGCAWSGRACPGAHDSSVIEAVWQVWKIYIQYDPLFLDIPDWLRVLCSIEVFLFGPLYLITAWGIFYQSSWLRAIATPFSGALIYSTIVYFAMEIIENVPGTNLWLVFAVNLPWTIVPSILLWRCCCCYSEEEEEDDDEDGGAVVIATSAAAPSTIRGIAPPKRRRSTTGEKGKEL